MTVVTPTERPKSGRNRCVIEGFVGVYLLFLVSHWDLHVFLCRDQSLLDLSCLRTFEFRAPLGTSLLLSAGIGAFVIGLGQNSSFFSFCM